MFGVQNVLVRNCEGDCSVVFSEDNRSGSMNSLIFMLFLIFGTLEVILFKTMIALDLTDNGTDFVNLI